MPRYPDSLDKIICSYFAAMTKEVFTFKGVTYHPKPLYLSRTLLRKVSCQLGCGACCPRFSLDYLPTEKKVGKESKRVVKLNDLEFRIFSDLQEDNENHHCHNLTKDGTCGIHGRHPFSCDFEMLRVLIKKERNTLQKSIFPRGWNMTRVCGKKGVWCKVTEEDDTSETIRKLIRLKKWMDYFKIKETFIEEACQAVSCRALPILLCPQSHLKLKPPIIPRKEH